MSRQRWTWCPEAAAELSSLKKADSFLQPELAARLIGATTRTSRRPGERAVGRVRQLAVITSTTYWVLLVSGGTDAGSEVFSCIGAREASVIRPQELMRWR